MLLWNSKVYTIHGRTGRARYGKKLALLGLVTVTLLAGGLVLTLPMHNEEPNTHPQAAISLKNDGGIQVQSVATPTVTIVPEATEQQAAPTVTVNGQPISVPAAGSSDHIIQTDQGNLSVHTDTTPPTTSTNAGSSSITISVQGAGSISTKTESIGGNKTVNILTR